MDPVPQQRWHFFQTTQVLIDVDQLVYQRNEMSMLKMSMNKFTTGRQQVDFQGHRQQKKKRVFSRKKLTKC